MTLDVPHEIQSKEMPEMKGNGVWLNPWSKVYKSKFHGPCFIDRFCKIGPNVEIGKYTGFHDATYAARCTIGAFCSFGSRNSINPFNHPVDWLSSHEFQYPNLSFFWMEEFQKLDRQPRDGFMVRPATIGNDIWSGDNVIILNGLTIGDGCIIGAGTVVTKDLEPYSIAVGNPARVIRKRFTDNIIERLLKLKWWRLDLLDMSGLPFNKVDKDLLDKLEEILVEKGLSID